MRSPSGFEAPGLDAAVVGRDAELVRFAASVVDAARQSWGDQIIAEGNGSFDPRQLYTETHYALAAVILSVRRGGERSLLDLAESRLRLWATGTFPLTFFNAMAICLAAVVFRRSGAVHPGLETILGELIAATREHRGVAYRQWCGNNAYLQQVAVDTVLLPVARDQEVTRDGIQLLLREFLAFRTDEGLFYDLPRIAGQRERLLPPTYIMKMLFLLGICHELHPAPELADLFRKGIEAVLPLLTRDGNLSYFGRTDNSPFALGLTIFNLRKGARLSPDRAPELNDACRRAERFLATFPRASSGVLESNRFADASSAAEAWYSKDAYAYVAQYSLSACAYALLGLHWFPAADAALPGPSPNGRTTVATSADLGVVKLTGRDRELVLRTRSEMTSWDRRYLGPTILRYSVNGKLLVGAISRTISTDRVARSDRAQGGLRGIVQRFRDSYVDGAEHLDGTAVGFLPVLRRGPNDYVPYTPVSVEATPARASTRHQMLRVRVRGAYPCFLDALQVAHAMVPGLTPKEYVQPLMTAAPAMELSREVSLGATSCDIEDRISGDLKGTELLFSVRRLPGAAVRVDGLVRRGTLTGWSSDGRQHLELYSARPSGSSIHYRCEITEA